MAEALRIGIMGCGFWSQFQLAGWKELPGVEIAAVWNRTRDRAARIAERFAVPTVHASAEALVRDPSVDVVDIITDTTTHAHYVRLAADAGKPVICQKPLAGDVETARQMASRCADAGVPLLVHENFRWQTPIRALHAAMQSGAIGRIFRARIDFINGFPVFDNQPFLRDAEKFILADLGTHLLDVARFLFGECSSLFCDTAQTRTDIRGENVASLQMRLARARHDSDVIVQCNMSYAGNPYEHHRFPQTLAFVEGEQGTIELTHDYWLHTTTREGTTSRRHPPPVYPWADPDYAVVHASIVPCLENLRAALQGGAPAETTAEDNLKTLELVDAAYWSAEHRRAWTPGREMS